MGDRQCRFAKRALVATIPVLLVACGKTDSSDGGPGGTPIRTREMHMTATVEAADEITTKISVRLHSGDPRIGDWRLDDLFGTDYHLTGGDALDACVGAQCKRLTHDVLLNYETDLAYVAEMPYTIALSRSVERSAPSSVVTLPVPFTILTPSPGLRVTNGDWVTVQWSPSGANEIVGLVGEARCEHADNLRTTRALRLATDVNTGTFVVQVDEILGARPGFPLTQARIMRCDVKIEVAHERRGTVDAAFGGDRIVGAVVRTVTLDYIPTEP